MEIIIGFNSIWAYSILRYNKERRDVRYKALIKEQEERESKKNELNKVVQKK